MIKVGDRVRFTAEFCRNTGQYTGWTPFARGTVSEIFALGRELHTKSTVLAVVTWDGDGISSRANVKNLEVCR